MQRAKAFFYLSLGTLVLAGSIHLGARMAQSQDPTSKIVAYGGEGGTAVAENGDVFATTDGSTFAWEHRGNVFAGAPVQATQTTWGRVKAERR